MNRMRVLIGVAFALVAVAAVWAYRHSHEDEASPYRFATVERGDLEAIVSATGKLSAVTTVQVGTQVSGQIEKILVDFNDRVKQGQLIARIDPTLQEQAVRDAQAGVERNQAELEQAQREYDRNLQLFERKVLTEIEFNTAKYALAVARANVKSAQVTLDRARKNLAYTEIYAPIDGIVVERNVDVGQTVAASLNTPQLFLIANDLAHMQILASVDESDIGMIRDGQSVRFSVQAYPNVTFQGTVQQVRLQSATVENVVNYTVVVAVENPDAKLLPGMTATVEFVTGSVSNALLVPNAALRFRPSEAMLAEVRGARSGSENAPAGQRRSRESRGAGAAEPGSASQRGNGTGRRPANAAMLWYLDDGGKLAMARARTGITDGQRTQIESDALHEGMQIIVGVTQAAQNETSNPFQAPMQAGPQRPPGTF
ncbi:MAG TPA: efflux RND transporter periplasmic adaptor subunit [Steroidobacteraceae bacterium]|nr:efflux RND transporter periplasmic adaptor subunit [Steroidobacteraceae bacterium]